MKRSIAHRLSCGLAVCVASAGTLIAQQAQLPRGAPIQEILQGDAARAYGAARGWITKATNAQTGATIELVQIVDGEPQYYTALNQRLTETIRTADIQPWTPAASSPAIARRF